MNWAMGASTARGVVPRFEHRGLQSNVSEASTVRKSPPPLPREIFRIEYTPASTFAESTGLQRRTAVAAPGRDEDRTNNSELRSG